MSDIKPGVSFSNFTVLPSGEMEADIEVTEEFRVELFEQLKLNEGVPEDEEKFITFVSTAFQEMLTRMKYRKDPEAFVNEMVSNMREKGDL